MDNTYQQSYLLGIFGEPMDSQKSPKSSQITQLSSLSSPQQYFMSNDEILKLLNRLKAYDEKLPELVMKNVNKKKIYVLVSDTERLLQVFNQTLRFVYLEMLIDGNEMDEEEIGDIVDTLDQIEEDIKQSNTREEFFQLMTKGTKLLMIKSKKQVQSRQIRKLISLKLEEIDQLLHSNALFAYFLRRVSLKCQKYDIKFKNSKFNSLTNFTKYLQKAKISLKSPLKPQIHNFLLRKNSFITSFNAEKFIQGTFLHKNKYYHQLNIPFQVQIPFTRLLNYTKQIQLKGQKKYSGSKCVSRCTNISNFQFIGFFFNIKDICHACNRQLIEIPYAGVQQYDLRYEKKGVVLYDKKQIIETNANIIKMKQYFVNIPYRKLVNINKDFEVTCDDHHRCSCKQLAEIVINTKETYEQIIYYLSLIDLQQNIAELLQKPLKKQNIPTPYDQQTPTPSSEQTPNQDETPTPNQQTINQTQSNHKIQLQKKFTDIVKKCEKLMTKFNLKGYNIKEDDVYVKDLTLIIHKQLSNNFHFSVPVIGKTQIKIQHQQMHQFLFQGGQCFTGSLQHSGQAYYEDEYEYNAQLPYKGKVKIKTCYEDCSFCQIKLKEEDIEGTVHVCRKGTVSGVVPFHQVKKWEKYVPYSEIATFFEAIQKEIEVDYKEECKVTCEKNERVGFGHHSCTSCGLWQQFITAFVSLLEVKESLKSKINKNRTYIQQILYSY